MNRRCDRLATESDSASDQDWKEMALWLWEYHNAVSVRLLDAEADAKLWPTMNGCVGCLKFDGKWNETRTQVLVSLQSGVSSILVMTKVLDSWNSTFSLVTQA
jgi:hypothetical protein